MHLPLIIFFLVSHFGFLFSEETPKHEIDSNWQNSIRSKALESLDKMLSWTFDQQRYVYCLKAPLQEELFQTNDQNLIQFARKYSYFSDEKPLVGKVSDDEADLIIASKILSDIQKTIRNSAVVISN